jgi:hypothetical protein
MTDKCNCHEHSEEPEYTQFRHLAYIGIGAVIILFTALWVSPHLFDSDPEAFWRYILLKFPYTVVQVVLLLLAVCFADFIMPRHSLDCIAQDSLSNSIFYSAFVIALALIMAFG